RARLRVLASAGRAGRRAASAARRSDPARWVRTAATKKRARIAARPRDFLRRGSVDADVHAQVVDRHAVRRTGGRVRVAGRAELQPDRPAEARVEIDDGACGARRTHATPHFTSGPAP